MVSLIKTVKNIEYRLYITVHCLAINIVHLQYQFQYYLPRMDTLSQEMPHVVVQLSLDTWYIS